MLKMEYHKKAFKKLLHKCKKVNSAFKQIVGKIKISNSYTEDLSFETYNRLEAKKLSRPFEKTYFGGKRDEAPTLYRADEKIHFQ